MAHGFQNGGLGDGVEDDPLDGLVFQHALAAQHFKHVPGNRLSLAVRIGCENDSVGVLDRAGDVGEPLGGLAVHFPLHREVLLRVDGAVLGG